MIRVDLVYSVDCVKLQQLRASLMQVFLKLELPPHWHEWSMKDREAPPYVRGFPSSTIFINGTPLQAGRLFLSPSHSYSLDALEHAMREANSNRIFKPSKVGKIIFVMLSLPFLMIMLLPSMECPFCWPGYTFLNPTAEVDMYGLYNFTAYFFPIILASMVFSIGAFIYRSILKGVYPPLFLAITAGLAMLSSKVISFDANLEHIGSILYIFSLVWHLLDSKHFDQKNCPRCKALKIS